MKDINYQYECFHVIFLTIISKKILKTQTVSFTSKFLLRAISNQKYKIFFITYSMLELLKYIYFLNIILLVVNACENYVKKLTSKK